MFFLCFCLLLFVCPLAFCAQCAFVYIFCICLFKLLVYLCVCVNADYVSGGEMFTHLYQRDHFPEEAVRIYIGEIILALEHLHKVGVSPYSAITWFFTYWFFWTLEDRKQTRQAYRGSTVTYCLIVLFYLICCKAVSYLHKLQIMQSSIIIPLEVCFSPLD